jgi:c-di-GMP-binding flagellar brake protein YcgR
VSQSILPLAFPEASQHVLFWLGATLCLLFLVAVLIELVRRRSRRRQLIEVEWDTIHRLIREKEFSKQEVDLLTGVIRRHADDSPVQVVTARRDFDRCVEAEMKALLADGNEDQFRETGIMLREIRVRLELDYVPFGQRIHSTRELQPPQEIWLAPVSSGNAQWIRGSVLAVDEAHLHVTAREDKGAKFAEGGEIRCHFWREDDARYEFRATVAHKEGAPPTWSLLHVEDLRRIQAREYYRIRYNQETNIGVLSAFRDGAEDLGHRRVVTRMRGNITSLSAGGLAAVTQHPCQAQTLMRVDIELPNETPFEVEVNTVAVDPIAGGRYLLRGAFVSIADERREAIARYVMRCQQPQFTPRETLAGPQAPEKVE